MIKDFTKGSNIKGLAFDFDCIIYSYKFLSAFRLQILD